MSVLETAVSAASVLKPSVLVRTFGSIAAVIKGAFGQLATRLFWTDLGRLVVRTMVNAFLLTIGGRVVEHVKKQDPTIAPATAAASGFSNGYQPRQEFTRTDFRTYGQSTQQPAAAASPFPGW